MFWLVLLSVNIVLGKCTKNGSFVTRNDLDSEVVNLHVDILKPPRGKKTFSTWRRNETSEESNETSEESNETSEESNETSEESNETSEVFFLLHVENKKIST